MTAALLLLALLAAGDGDATAAERDFYTVDFLSPPEGAVVEVGGMDFLPDGRLVVSTRRGQVWIVDDPTAADPKQARFHLFAEGLHEGLGLSVVDGVIYVLQRTELSRLLDRDGDGVCDRIEMVANDWGVSGNYHEFAYGLPHDRDGNFFISLNVGFWDPQWWHGQAKVPYRGWVLRIGPDGSVTPWALGFRSPNGLGLNAAGDLFVTDNQGDWMPSCPVIHVRQGRFYGHPASLNWTRDYRAAQRRASDTVPPDVERTPPALWLPYGLSRSAGSPTCDATGGKFGPFADQMFIAELTNGLLVRADLEKVQGEYQGAAFLFRREVGSANRVKFGPDGTLFVGLTNRGWGGEAPDDGISRVRFTGRLPMEMKTMRLIDDGFAIAFTKPLGDRAILPEQVALTQYDYNYWWDYGCPEKHRKSIEITGLSVRGDLLTIHTRALEPGTVVRLHLSGVVAADGTPLLHEQADYTLNRLLSGPAAPVAKQVPPPPTREQRSEGFLTLFDGASLDGWNGSGWRVAELLPAKGDRTHLPIRDGEGAMVNDQGVAGQTSDLVTHYEFGDVEAKISFAIPRGGNSGIYFMDRYELQIADSFGKKQVGFGDCGGIYEAGGDGPHWPGRAPAMNAALDANDLQTFEVIFRAPRFDARGQKTENARFVSVTLNDEVILEDVEVPGPTRGGAPGPEVPRAPLRLQGDHGPVAFDTVRVRAAQLPPQGEGWRDLLADMQPVGGAVWRTENGVTVSSGERGLLVSKRGDFKNFSWRARLRINHGGESGLLFRADTSDPPSGYEAPVTSSSEVPVKTGSLAGLWLVKTRLVPPNTWFTEQVTCEDVPDGVHIVIAVNDVVIADCIDKKQLHGPGHLAFEHRGPGTSVQIKDALVREW